MGLPATADSLRFNLMHRQVCLKAKEERSGAEFTLGRGHWESFALLLREINPAVA